MLRVPSSTDDRESHPSPLVAERLSPAESIDSSRHFSSVSVAFTFVCSNGALAILATILPPPVVVAFFASTCYSFPAVQHVWNAC